MKYQNLLEELRDLKVESEESKWYYVSTFGFQMKDPFFKPGEDEDDKHE